MPCGTMLSLIGLSPTVMVICVLGSVGHLQCIFFLVRSELSHLKNQNVFGTLPVLEPCPPSAMSRRESDPNSLDRVLRR